MLDDRRLPPTLRTPRAPEVAAPPDPARPTIANTMPLRPRDVLLFWFGPPPHATRASWFGKDPHFDATIRDRFSGAIDAALAGALDDWRADPQEALAHVLLLDQFTRNAFRGTARAFAGDGAALATAVAVVDAGRDAALDRHERSFLYLPFEHAEDEAMQERSIALYTRLRDDTGDAAPLGWAEKHAAIVRRFGRYPHRNAILGRASTPEEIAFLRTPGSHF
jgi:uncharacterized protein (DUF924 family)